MDASSDGNCKAPIAALHSDKFDLAGIAPLVDLVEMMAAPFKARES
jgi:hypothetical protein